MNLNKKIYNKDFDILYSKKDITPGFLTKEEAKEDFFQCIYLLESSCASFVEQKNKKKHSFNLRVKKILHELEACENIKTSYFLTHILGKLTDDLLDKHSYYMWNFSDETNNYIQFQNFTPACFAFFSELIFKKKGRHYFSISNSSIIFNGKKLNNKTKIKQNTLYFVPIISNKSIYYKAAKFFTTKSPKKQDFIINGKNYIFSEQMSNIEESISYFTSLYSLDTNSYYLRFSNIQNKEEKDIFDFLKKNIEILKSKDNIIIDNRNYLGGNPHNQIEFFFDLFEIDKNILEKFTSRKIRKKDDILEGKCLISNPIIQRELENIKDDEFLLDSKDALKKFYENELLYITNGEFRWSKNKHKDLNIKINKRKSFRGKIIIIVNQKTASLGEELYFLLKEEFHYNKVFIVGINSKGCISYGNPHLFYLKNSGICLNISSRTNCFASSKLGKKYIEGRGVIPDIWTTNDTELRETLYYICNLNS